MWGWADILARPRPLAGGLLPQHQVAHGPQPGPNIKQQYNKISYLPAHTPQSRRFKSVYTAAILVRAAEALKSGMAPCGR